MRGDVAQAFGLAGLGHSTGTYTGTAVDDDVEVDWRDEAACHPRNRPDGVTPAEWAHRWFPSTTGDQIGQGSRRAKPSDYPGKVDCDRCPARERCLEEHIDELAGMWGGTTPADRRVLRGGRAKQTRGVRNEVERLARLGTIDGAIAARLRISINVVRDYRQDAGILLGPGGRREVAS